MASKIPTGSLSQLPPSPEVASQDLMVEELQPLGLSGQIQLIGSYLSLYQRFFIGRHSPLIASSFPDQLQVTPLALSQNRWIELTQGLARREVDLSRIGFNFPRLLISRAMRIHTYNLENQNSSSYPPATPRVFDDVCRFTMREGLTPVESRGKVQIFSLEDSVSVPQGKFLPMQAPTNKVLQICVLSQNRVTMLLGERTLFSRGRVVAPREEIGPREENGTIVGELWNPSLNERVSRQVFPFGSCDLFLLGRWMMAGGRIYDMIDQNWREHRAPFSPRQHLETVFLLHTDEECTLYAHRDFHKIPRCLQIFGHYSPWETCLATVILPTGYDRMPNNRPDEDNLQDRVAIFRNHLLLHTSEGDILSYNLLDKNLHATLLLRWKAGTDPARVCFDSQHMLALSRGGDMDVCRIEPKVDSKSNS